MATKTSSRKPTATPKTKAPAKRKERPAVAKEIADSDLRLPEEILAIAVAHEEKEKAADAQTGKKVRGQKKPKLVRDSFTLPEADYALFKELKARCLDHGVEVKKGELLRIAIQALAKMPVAKLLESVGRLERLKTGRPAK
jgi:hypothetical protein